MFNLPERKESPIMGVAGVGGGAGSNLVTAKASDPTYVDDVFSADIYNGTGGLYQQDNGIDLTEHGEMVWFKRRNSSDSHAIFDTVRGADKLLVSNSSGQHTTVGWGLQFNSNGWQVNSNDGQINNNGSTYVAWTFRKCPGFFDIVTWSGNGVQGREIPHNLGVRPGMIILKCTNSSSENWIVYHKGQGNGTYGNSATKFMNLNSSDASQTGNVIFNDTAPTDTVFSVGSENSVNGDSKNFVAYLWADGSETAAKIFGKDKDQAIVSCEAYEGSGSSSSPSTNPANNKDIGFEPQFTIIKGCDSTNDWKMFCSAMQYGQMMGDFLQSQTSNTMTDARSLIANNTTSEGGGSRFTTNGNGLLMWYEGGGSVNNQSETFCNLSVRMRDALVCKPDLDGSKYASAVVGDSTAPCFEHDFEVDMGIVKVINSSGDWRLGYRKSYKFKAVMNDTSAPSSEPDFSFAGGYSTNETVFSKGYFNTSLGTSYVSYGFRRGPGFDVQIYAGDGSNGQAKPHSLGAVPEIIAYRRWSSYEDWTIYSSRANNGTNSIQDAIQFNTNGGEFGFDTSGNGTPPTATHFYAGYHDRVGGSNHTYVALLFASVDGISKIGQYTGNSANNTLTLGFAPKFIWIKRTDTSANWIIMSEAQGWSSGADTVGEFNNANQMSTNKEPGNPTANGFTVTGSDSDWNTSGGTYLYYAHA